MTEIVGEIVIDGEVIDAKTQQGYGCEALDPSVPKSSYDKLEMELRRELWLSHGHEGIYGDDGEMQCIECAPYGCTDYKRALIDEVRKAAELARAKRATQSISVYDKLLADHEKLKEVAGKMEVILNNIHYCFQNIWALDRKEFEKIFMPKIKEILDAYSALGKEGQR